MDDYYMMCRNATMSEKLSDFIEANTNKNKFQIFDEVNYISSIYKKDYDYFFKMEMACLSYELDSVLDKGNRIHFIDGISFAAKLLEKMDNRGIFSNISTILDDLELRQIDGTILLNEHEEDYFKYGIIAACSINSLNVSNGLEKNKKRFLNRR